MGDGEKEAEVGPAVLLPPPVLFLVSIAVAVVVHIWVWPSPGMLPGTTAWFLGGAVFVVGVMLMVKTHRPFSETGQDPTPWKPVPSLITSGPYQRSRNPMYIAVMLMQTGIGVGVGILWILVAIPIVLVILNTFVIRHEEAYLEAKFGDEYRAYCHKVRRWL
jgi:protein-S-isoprenylcysteine O-methyltransferase Ste14